MRSRPMSAGRRSTVDIGLAVYSRTARPRWMFEGVPNHPVDVAPSWEVIDKHKARTSSTTALTAIRALMARVTGQ